MGHTPYGYSIENGCATIKEDEANKIRKLYENYLSGMALAKAAAAAGISSRRREYGAPPGGLPVWDGADCLLFPAVPGGL